MESPQSVPTALMSWGELLWDSFPDGVRLGGAAANVAYHAAQIGAQALLVSRVGNDELGRRALDELERSGVTTRFVQVDPARPTGTVNVEIRDGEPRYRIATRVAWDHIELCDELAERMTTVDAACFSTLAQRSEPSFAALGRALSALPRNAMRLCDLNLRRPFVSRELVERALALATAVKLNESEAALLGEMFGATAPVDWLLERTGVETVALTRGARGAFVARRTERIDVPGIAVTTGDAVGAGDAFAAVFAVELARGRALDVAARRAVRYSSFVASARGAMPAVPAAVRCFEDA